MLRPLIVALSLLCTAPVFANDTRVVQRGLSNLGYPVGKVDGKYGRQTENAIRLYEIDWKLPTTGKLTKELVERLTHKHPDTKGRMQKVENGDCEIWNNYPQAREIITFEPCSSPGPIDGKGQVIWRWFAGGDWQTAAYTGEVKAGKMNGRGLLNYPNGNIYEGELKDDKRHGTGIHTWSRGNTYEGSWQDDKPHGKGVYLQNDVRYEGEWKQGCFSKGKRRTWIETTKKACGFR